MALLDAYSADINGLSSQDPRKMFLLFDSLSLSLSLFAFRLRHMNDDISDRENNALPDILFTAKKASKPKILSIMTTLIICFIRRGKYVDSITAQTKARLAICVLASSLPRPGLSALQRNLISRSLR